MIKINRLSARLMTVPYRTYFFNENGPDMISRNPGVTARRIIDCVGTRLRKIDPLRWDNVPITFMTHFRDEAGFSDIRTCINIHDALEREFNIEIHDRATLISDIETAFYIVNQHHESH